MAHRETAAFPKNQSQGSPGTLLCLGEHCSWKGRCGRAVGAWRGLRVGLDCIRGLYWTLSIYYTPFRNPQRGIMMLLLSSINMRHPLPPSMPKSKLPGECLGLSHLC